MSEPGPPPCLLVTGANGFIGRALLREAGARGWRVRAATRRPWRMAEAGESVPVGDLDAGTDWSAALAGCDAVVHLASRVHVLDPAGAADWPAFRAANVEATEHLARSAAAAGVRRLVFLSTVKVLGEGGPRPYRDGDAPDGREAYARSKLEAEERLLAVAAETGLEVAILRPPLVYGPGVKANFLAMLDKVAAGWPIPVGALSNRRSFCYLGNLLDAVFTVLAHPAAAGRRFLVADAETLPLREFVVLLGRALGRPARIWPVPEAWLRWAARLLGREAALRRLTGSLEVDISGIRETLGWNPPWPLERAVAETARWYRGRHES